MTARLILTLALAALAACDLPPATHSPAQSESGGNARPAQTQTLDRPVYHGDGKWTQVGPDGPGISSGGANP